MEHNLTAMRAWIVGQNETAILGDGWYGRCPEWFGLPYRESFGACSLRLPEIPKHGRITLVLGAPLCFHCPTQSLTIRCGDKEWRRELTRQPDGYGWQKVEIELADLCPDSGPVEIRLESQAWRHGDYEEIPDFREVGILLGAVFITD